MSARTRRLPLDVQELLDRRSGLIDVTSARDAQISVDRLLALADAKELARVAAGVYASAQTLVSLDEWQRHLLIARAFALSCSSDALLTGWSAVPVWDLPTVRRPPRIPTVLRPKVPGLGPTVTSRGRVLVANIPDVHRHRRESVGVVSQAWTAAEIARAAPIADALIVADAVVRRGFVLAEAVEHMVRWASVGRARWVAEHADPLAESPIETLGRFTCIEFDLPMPISNAWVGADGPTYRVDGLWPFHWAAHEADGAVKYDNRPDASSIVAKQGEREWALRRLGLDLARYGWELAANRRAELAARFAALLHDNPPRAEPIRWWKQVPGVGPVEPEPSDWPSPHPSSIILPAGWQDELGRWSRPQ